MFLFFRKFSCDVCSMQFTRKDNMKRHALRVHEVVVKDSNSIEVRTSCHYPACNESFYQKSDLIHHLKNKHSVEVCVENKTFKSIEDIEDWKEKEELKNCVYFSKQSGEKSTKQKKKLNYYICQRDGHSKPHKAVNEPATKTNIRYKRGKIKTGSFCPARMSVSTFDDGKVEMLYIKSHNHPVTISDTKYHPIPRSVKANITAKVAIGVPVKDIYRDLRSSLGHREQRDVGKEVLTKTHMITKNLSQI